MAQVATKIAQNFDDTKYRRLRVTNPRFGDSVWKHAPARELLELTGWVVDPADADHILLPPECGAGTLIDLIRSHPCVPRAVACTPGPALPRPSRRAPSRSLAPAVVH